MGTDHARLRRAVRHPGSTWGVPALASLASLLTIVILAGVLAACGGTGPSVSGGTSTSTPPAAKGGGARPDATAPVETPPPAPPSVSPGGDFLWPPFIPDWMRYPELQRWLANYLRTGEPAPLLLEVEYYTAVPRADVLFANRERDRLYYDFASGTRVGPCDVNQDYPLPCTYFALVRPGAEITLVAGDSRAGYWPILERSEGSAECTRARPFASDTVELCTFRMTEHRKLRVYWSGGESPGLLHFVYPTCPTQRTPPGDPRTPGFAARCQ